MTEKVYGQLTPEYRARQMGKFSIATMPAEATPTTAV
jgi:hypothetical protein